MSVRSLNLPSLAPTAAGVIVHGGGRRPGRQPTLDVDALAAWNAGTARAVEANRRRPEQERRRDARQRYPWVTR